MSKEDLIELQGVVTEVLAGGNYKVKCGGEPRSAGPAQRQDAPVPDPRDPGRPRDRRRLPLRPEARPHHLPRQVPARSASLPRPPLRPRPRPPRLRPRRPDLLYNRPTSVDSLVSVPRAAVASLVFLRSEIPARHPSAAILGEERMGAGVAVGRRPSCSPRTTWCWARPKCRGQRARTAGRAACAASRSTTRPAWPCSRSTGPPLRPGALWRRTSGATRACPSSSSPARASRSARAPRATSRRSGRSRRSGSTCWTARS